MNASRIITIVTLLLALQSTSNAQDQANIFDLEWSPDGNYLAISSTQGVLIYDTADFSAEPRILPGTEDEGIPLLTFDPMTGVLLASNTTDDYGTELLLFDPTTATLLPDDEQLEVIFEGSTETIIEVAFAPHGTFVAAAGYSALSFYPRSQDVRLPPFPTLPPPATPFSLAFHPSEDFLAVGSGYDDGKVYITVVSPRAAPDVEPRVIELGYGVQQVGWSPDGSYLAVQGVFNALTLYDGETLEEIPLGIDATVNSFGFAFSPGGSVLVSGGNSIITLYELPSREVTDVWSLPGGDAAAAFRLAFSPDGTKLASIDTSGDLLIWNPITGEVLDDVGDFDGGFDRRWG